MGRTTGRVGPALAGVREVSVDGSVALFSPATGRVVVLNDTAALIWRLSDGRLTGEQVVERLAQAHAVAADDIRGQVWGTVRSFAEQGFIAPVDDRPGR